MVVSCFSELLLQQLLCLSNFCFPFYFILLLLQTRLLLFFQLKPLCLFLLLLQPLLLLFFVQFLVGVLLLEQVAFLLAFGGSLLHLRQLLWLRLRLGRICKFLSLCLILLHCLSLAQLVAFLSASGERLLDHLIAAATCVVYCHRHRRVRVSSLKLYDLLLLRLWRLGRHSCVPVKTITRFFGDHFRFLLSNL